MVRCQVSDLVVQMFYLYHQFTMEGSSHEDSVDIVLRLTRIAENYADGVISSLPEHDIEVLRNGLVSSYLSFLTDVFRVSALAKELSGANSG